MKSPFKFLDSYDKNDSNIFFGRDDEIEKLYEMVFQTNLIMLYGQSGTGKTSIIKCGLANRFLETDWYDMYVRRRDNLNNSFWRSLSQAAETPLEEGMSIKDAVYSLYLDYMKPIYLIFDQFEEIFILGSQEEQDTFFENLKELITEEVPVTVILSMREEYIALLYKYEQMIPQLFNKRIRIEPMSHTNLRQVVTGTCGAFDIDIENKDKTVTQIIDNISDGHTVQLSYLQVYLDKLFREAVKEAEDIDELETV